MEVSIIIVNYNTKELIIQCVNSIIYFTKNLVYEIIVVDNASTDGSQLALSQIDGVYLIESKTNLGFGKANNLAAKEAKGEFLFFLNSDTLLVENSLLKLFEFYHKNRTKLRLGVLGCILTDVNGAVNGYGDHFPTPKEAIANKFKRIPILGRLISGRRPLKIVEGQTFFVIDYVIGADMFIPKNIFIDFGKFNEAFFMYYEESDLQLQIKRGGFNNVIMTGTKIIHLEDGTGKLIKKYSNNKRKILHESRLIYMKKNFPVSYNIFKIFDWFFLTLSRFDSKYTKQENKEYFSYIKQKI